jgi:dTDP-L-rhamnose 4-epimerase
MYQVDHYVDTNTRGTGLLLDILVNDKHRVGKLIVASSVGVFGEGAYSCSYCGPQAPGLRPESRLKQRLWEPACEQCGADLRPEPTPEDKPLYRDNIYSMSKFHQEEMSLLVGKTYDIPTVAPRFFNVYGPRQSLGNPYAGVAAIFLSRLLNDKQPMIFEDGGQLRDFVSVRDVVDCLMLMIETNGADQLPVNIGSGSHISILELARLLAGLLRKDIEPDTTQQGRKFDIRHCFADIERARETLGYAPVVSLEEGMAELIKWAAANEDTAVDKLDFALEELRRNNLLAE